MVKIYGKYSMQELDVTFSRTVQIFWSWAWRSTIYGLLVGAAIGFIASLITMVFGFDAQVTKPVAHYLSITAGLFVSLLVLSKVLKMKFSSFRIALVQQ
ncbi:hypothetical protein CWO84_17315 [Methylomonas sp. Kb3]|nr:hypothetical protein CWO84_17315 [Methylomonas sp. Kb3]